MKIQTIFKKSVVFSTVMLLCLLMALLSVPAVAAEQEYAAEVYNAKTGELVASYDTVAAAFADASEDQLIKLYQDANLTLDPHKTYKVDKNGHMFNAASDAGFGAKIVENRDGTVTVSTYKNQGEWFKKMDVAVAGTFGMRFYFSGLGTLAENDNAYLEVKVPNKDKTVSVRKLYKKDFKVDEDGLYYFVAEVAQAQLTDSIVFQIVNGSEKGRLRQYAFRDYADQLFKNADEIKDKVEVGNQTEAEKAVVDAVAPVKKMLNLGAQAQALFDYNTNDLANKGLYDESSNNPVNEQTIESTKVILSQVGEAKKVKTTKITPAEYSLFLESQTALQFRFTVTDLAEGEIPTAAVSYGGNATQKAVAVRGKLNDGETDCWYVSVSNIPAQLYDTEFTVTLKCGGETATYSASVLQWLNAALASGKPAQKNTATALYQYYLEMKGDDAVVKPDAAKCEHPNTHVEVLKAATCAAAGTSQTVCSDCGEITFANGTITKLENHSYETYAEVAATCTSDGWKSYKVCTVCGDTDGTTQEVIKATGHSYTSGYTFNGKDVIKTGTCDACRKEVTEIVSLADTITSIAGVTEIGQTDTYDWKSQAATTITFTYDSEKIAGKGTGTFAYDIGAGFQELDGTTITLSELTDTVTLVIGYEIQDDVYVPVATIYNVGECGHDGTLSTEWVKGEGYVSTCDACGKITNTVPFKFTLTTDNGLVKNPNADDRVTSTVVDGVWRLQGVVEKLADWPLIQGAYQDNFSKNQYKYWKAYKLNTDTSKYGSGKYLTSDNKGTDDTAEAAVTYTMLQTKNVGGTYEYVVDEDGKYTPVSYANGAFTARTDVEIIYDESGNPVQHMVNNKAEFYSDFAFTGKTAQYFVVKYRMTKSLGNKSLDIYTRTTDSGVPYTQISLIADDQWHVAVVDLAAAINGEPDAFVAGNTIKWLRVDFINDFKMTKDQYVEYAYFGMTDSLDEIQSVLKNQVGEDLVCAHGSVESDASGNALWYSTPGSTEHWNICLLCGANINATAHESVEVLSKGDGNTHAAKCTDCGVEFNASCVDAELIYNNESKMYDGCCECGAVVNANKSYFLVFADSGKYMSNSNCNITKNLVDDDGTTTYARVTESKTSSDDSFYMYVDGTEKSGQYMVIKYRVPTNYNKTNFGNTYLGTTNCGLTGANGSKGDQCGGIGKVNNTGSWQIAVIDLSTTSAATRKTETVTPSTGDPYIRSPKFIKDEDGCYYTRYVRMTLANLHSGSTCSCTDTDGDGVIDHVVAYMDVDFVAFADNLDAVANYITNVEIKTGEDDTVINPCQHDFKDKGMVSTDEGHATACAACGQATGEFVAHTPDVSFIEDNGDGTHSVNCSVCNNVYNDDHTKASYEYNSTDVCYNVFCSCGAKFGQTGVLLEVSPLVNTSMTNLTAQKSEDGTYVRYTAQSAADGGTTFIDPIYLGNGSVTGQYMIVKYRFPQGKGSVGTSTFRVYAASYDKNLTYAISENQQVGEVGSIVADNKWHYTVIDLSRAPDYDEVDGVYRLGFVRIGFSSVAVDDTFTQMDIATIGFADRVDVLDKIIDDSDLECAHGQVGDYTYSAEAFYDGVGYAQICAFCGEYVNVRPFATTLSPDKIKGGNKSTDYGSWNAVNIEITDEGTVKYSSENGTLGTTNHGSGYGGMSQSISIPNNVYGPYLIVKMRSNKNYQIEVYTNTVVSSAVYSITIDNGDGTTLNKSYAINATLPKYTGYDATTGESEWQILVINLDKKITTVAANGVDVYVPTDPLKLFRFDLLDSGLQAGEWAEFAYVGFTSNVEEIASVLGNEVEYCVHDASVVDTTKWIATEDGTKCGNPCTICGELLNLKAHTGDKAVAEGTTPNGTTHTETCTNCSATFEVEHTESTKYTYNESTSMYYKSCDICGIQLDATASYFLKQYNISSGSSVKLTTGEVDADGTKYTRVARNGSGETYIYLLSGNVQVTGPYMIVKYRAPEGSLTSSKFENNYTSTANYKAGAGATGTWFDNFGNLVADGEWKIMVYSFEGRENVAFSAVDGELSINYIRVTPILATTTDESGNYTAYMDIAFVAFADNLDAVANYITNVEIKTGEDDTVINPCQHSIINSEYEWNGNEYAQCCLSCGEVINNQPFKVYLNGVSGLGKYLGTNSNVTRTETENGIRYSYKEGGGATGESTTDFGLTGKTGRYLIIKYSNSNQRVVNVYANTAANSYNHESAEARADIVLTATEKDAFVVQVYDLEASVNGRVTYTTPAYESDKPILRFRFDYLNAWTAFSEDAYIEYAYIGLADSIENVKTVLTKLGAVDQTTCNHGFNNTLRSLYSYVCVDESNHQTVCSLCEKVISTSAHTVGEVIWNEQTDIYDVHCSDCDGIMGTRLFPATYDKDYFASHKVNGTTIDTSDGIGVKYVTGSDGAAYDSNGRITVELSYSSVGKYMIVKYKNNNSQSHIEVTIMDKANTGYVGRQVNYVSEDNGAAWHVVVVDLEARFSGASGYVVPDENGNFTYTNLLLDIHNTASTEGDWIEYAYIGFSNDIEKLQATLQATGDDAYCTHAYATDSTVCKWCGYDSSAAQLVVTTDSQTYTADQEITASVTVKNNPGFNAMALAITVDGEAIDGSSAVTATNALEVTPGATIIVEPAGDNTADYTTAEEVIVTVKIKASELGTGTHRIGVTVTEATNASEAAVDFATYQTTITVNPAVAE